MGSLSLILVAWQQQKVKCKSSRDRDKVVSCETIQVGHKVSSRLGNVIGLDAIGVMLGMKIVEQMATASTTQVNEFKQKGITAPPELVVLCTI